MRKRVTVVLMVAALAWATAVPAQAGPWRNRDVARGSAETVYESGEVRHFRFSAVATNRWSFGQGSVRVTGGETNLVTRFRVNCVNVVGDEATVTGRITRSNTEAPVGARFWFRTSGDAATWFLWEGEFPGYWPTDCYDPGLPPYGDWLAISGDFHYRDGL